MARRPPCRADWRVVLSAWLVPLLGLAAFTGVAPAAVAITAEVSVTVEGISPALVGSGQSVVVTGRVTNRGTSAVDAPEVVLTGSATPLRGRDDVAAWAAGEATTGGTPWASLDLPGRIAAGDSAAFELQIPSVPAGTAAAYAVLPLAVSANGSRVPTFLPVHNRREYTPLSLTWVVPITLAASGTMFGPHGPDRRRAWLGEIGPGGRLDRIVDDTSELPVLWAIDPTLLDPPDAIAEQRPTGAADGAAWDRIGADQRAETEERRAFRDRLVRRFPGHDQLLLPYADADIAAVTASPALGPLVRPLVARSAEIGATLGPHVRTDVAWPSDGLVSGDRAAALAASYAGRFSGLLGRASSLAPGAGTPTGPHRTRSGAAAILYDDRLSAAMLGLDRDPTGAVTRQRLIADSLALLDEFPSTARHVVVALPRSLRVTSGALNRVVTEVEAMPWIASASFAEVMAAASHGPLVPDVAPTETPYPANIPVDPIATSPPALNASRAAYLTAAFGEVEALAQVRVDGPEQRDLWSQALRQLTSVRLRGRMPAFHASAKPLRLAAQEADQAVAVTPEQINFFAESGRLQITVSNRLDVAVADLRVDLTALSPWLRLEAQPAPMSIGARAKATTTVEATALAAGMVAIRARLHTADGTRLGSDATLQVRVRPTGDWIYWAIGGVALLLLIAGWWRGRGRKVTA